jgi:multidrug efflux system outer membrane protein
MKLRAWQIRIPSAILAAALLLGGCMVGPDFVPPAVETPAAYRFEPAAAEEAPPEAAPSWEYRYDADHAAAAVNLKWWALFDDPVLYELVTTALANNLEVKTAAARIEEARAALGFTRADQYPRIDIEGSAAAGNFLGISRSETTDWAAFIAPTLSWEIDFWGRFRRATEAARADLAASGYGLRTIQLALVTEVAGAYYRLLDFRRRLEIARKTLESRTETLDIIAQRFEKGIVPELDLNQAQIQKEIAAAAIPQFERQVAQSEHAIRVLLGQLPGPVRSGRPLQRQSIPPQIPTGLPSSLLERRPDVAEASFRLHSQTAQIGVAEALRYPSFSLTGLLGLASSELADVTREGGVWSAGAGLLGPLFDFEQSKMRVDIEEARTRQVLYFYENTVLTAFREVEDALVAIDTYQRQVESVTRQVAAARNANELSLYRYDQGVTSYLEVLETERQLFSAELDLSELTQNQLNAYVGLYKALGGGWISPEAAAAEAEMWRYSPG